jgi:hypothetical protein
MHLHANISLLSLIVPLLISSTTVTAVTPISDREMTQLLQSGTPGTNHGYQLALHAAP